jgi:hypothetical protein
MNKIIYLKNGGSVKVGHYSELVFKEGWVHIKTEQIRGRPEIEKSIPSSNIKIIQEE